jgi:hypothetical protein
MQMIDESTSRAELEVAILSEPSLYARLDESKLLSGGYTDDGLREAIVAWIEAGNEAGC